MVMVRQFEKLLAAGTIGKMRTRNRIVMGPMVRNYATEDGFVTGQLVDHYTTHARGGAGLIIVEATFVDPAGRGFHRQLGIHSDRCLPGLNRLAEAIKEWGARAAIQLHHAGRQTSPEVTGMQVVAPSSVPCPVSMSIPRELTTQDVMELVETFARAALRARTAGFDAVELHGAHGYIVSQFLSQNTNRRVDKYGGDLDGRATFAVEILQKIKALAGKDFPVIVRINGEDLVEFGLEAEESQQLAVRLQRAGADALDISAGTYECLLNPRITSPFGMAPTYAPRGELVTYAEHVKRVVGIPVITVGSITPEMGEEIIEKGKADFIAIGRNLLVDPELPHKVARGEVERIRPCIRCNEMCIGRLFDGLEVRCTVNGEVSFESNRMALPLKPKEIAIIGGGPAGLEAARVAALRGHSVTVYEKETELGGHLREATVADFKDDLRSYKKWLIAETRRLGVRIETGVEITPEMFDRGDVDAVIIATGSIFSRPPIPGIELPLVTTATEVFLGTADSGKKPIIAGGGATGCELGLFLANRGVAPTIVEMLPDIATDVPTISRGALITSLERNNVRVLTNMKIVAIDETGVTAIGDQNVTDIEGDRVILAMGLKAENELYARLDGRVREIYLIGDGVEPRRVGEATRDGYRVGSII
ncbi:MAG: FAD-dependent oxidoreductase [Dehalococcoidia bacterium]|nr:FAD-dependent oxidoreductase [Dehalococcoidia bacterium]